MEASSSLLMSAPPRSSPAFYCHEQLRQQFASKPLLVSARAATIVSTLSTLRLRAVIGYVPAPQRALLLKDALIRLGPAWVKLGQMLATRPDIMPAPHRAALRELHDSVPPFDGEVAMRVVHSELPNASTAFKRIDTTPVAAASLGQVHRAELADGRRVALKIRRPGAADALRLDAHVLRRITEVLASSKLASPAAPTIVDELMAAAFEELDYTREAEKCAAFRTLYGNEHGVVAPAVHRHLTTERVLCLDWVDGAKLDDANALADVGASSDAARSELLRRGVRLSCKQLLGVGLMHADPHPGNLLATPRGNLAYLDFGACIVVPPPDRAAFARSIVHFMNRDGARLADDLHALGFLPEEADARKAATALTEALQRDDDSGGSGDGNGGSQMAITRAAAAVVSALSQPDIGFRVPQRHATIARALASLEGTANALYPGFDAVRAAYPDAVRELIRADDGELLWQLSVDERGGVRWDRAKALLATLRGAAEQRRQQRGSVSSSCSSSSSSSSSFGKFLPDPREEKEDAELLARAAESAARRLLSPDADATRHALADGLRASLLGGGISSATVPSIVSVGRISRAAMRLLSRAPKAWARVARVPLRAACERGILAASRAVRTGNI